MYDSVMKIAFILLISFSIMQAQQLTLMSKSTIYGEFKKNLLTTTCYDKTFKRNGIDQTCFLMGDGHKLHIAKKKAKLYNKKRHGRYTIRCRYDQKAKVFHGCYIKKVE